MMHDLNQNEINNVSGAGIFGNIGKALGTTIGGVVDDLMTAVNGESPHQKIAPATGQLGEGIGNILDLNITGAIDNIGQGVSNIIDTIKANKDQLPFTD